MLYAIVFSLNNAIEEGNFQLFILLCSIEMGLDVSNHIFRLFGSGGIHNYNDWTFENILKRKEENQLLNMPEAQTVSNKIRKLNTESNKQTLKIA